MTTKQVFLTSDFLAESARNPDGALAYMFVSAFGISLAALMDIAAKVIKSKDTKIVAIALAAAVQIRNNVVFVGRDYGDIRKKYPELIIEGQRTQQDAFNYSALHALGHLFCHLSTSSVAEKALKKAGSCITGEHATDNIAGNINVEIAGAWATEEKSQVLAYVAANRGSTELEAMIKTLMDKASTFRASLMKPSVPPPPAGGAGAGLG